MSDDAEVTIEEVVSLRGFRGSAAAKDADAVHIRGIPDPSACRERTRAQRPKQSPGPGLQQPTVTQPLKRLRWVVAVALLIAVGAQVTTPTAPCPIEGPDATRCQAPGTVLLCVETSLLHGSAPQQQLPAASAAPPVAGAETQAEEAADEAKKEEAAGAEEAKKEEERCLLVDTPREWRERVRLHAAAAGAGWALLSLLLGYALYASTAALPAAAPALLAGVAASGAAAAAAGGAAVTAAELLAMDGGVEAGAPFGSFALCRYAQWALLAGSLLAAAQVAAKHQPALSACANALSAPAPLLFLPAMLPAAAGLKLYWLVLVGASAFLFSYCDTLTARRRPAMTKEQAAAMLAGAAD